MLPSPRLVVLPFACPLAWCRLVCLLSFLLDHFVPPSASFKKGAVTESNGRSSGYRLCYSPVAPQSYTCTYERTYWCWMGLAGCWPAESRRCDGVTASNPLWNCAEHQFKLMLAIGPLFSTRPHPFSLCWMGTIIADLKPSDNRYGSKVGSHC